MANVFTISTPTQTLKADANGNATTVFTVTNATSRPIRGIAKTKPLGSTQAEWLKIDGETERDFPAGGTHQFTVTFNKPKPATPPTTPQPAQSFPFRLDAISAINPDEDFTEGQAVTVEIPEQKVEPPKKSLPWLWIIIGAVVLLIIIGVVIWLVSRGGGGGNPTPTPTPPASPTPRVVRMGPKEYGVDRPGADFHAFIAPSLQDCENACKENENCKAFTYGNPNVCWLKNVKPAPVNNPLFISGTKLDE